MTRPLPPADLLDQWAECGPEIQTAVLRILASGKYVLGEEVGGFECDFAGYLGVREAVGVASGTDALALALRGAGVGRGDEVVLPPYTFFATVEAVVRVGAVPVFADVDPATGNLDAARVAEKVSPKTRAVVPVHLYGTPADMDAIGRAVAGRPVVLVEDAAQAHGARFGGRRVGSIGRASAFSFYPTKNLSVAGDGGAVSTNDPEVGGRVRMLRDHARQGHYLHVAFGMNSRLDALQAAILRVKLPRLDRWNARRREVYPLYVDRLAGLPGSRLLGAPEGAECVHHLAPLLVPAGRRDAAREALLAEGIGAGVHYPVPLHLQPALAEFGWKKGDFPVSEELASRILTLPCTPAVTAGDVDRIGGILGRILG